VSQLARSHGAGVAGACTLLTHLFLLRSTWMPGLCFVGGKASSRTLSHVSGSEAMSFSLAGAGEQPEDALASCSGEAAERLSQVERPDDVKGTWPYARRARRVSPSLKALVEEALDRNQLSQKVPLDWMQGVDLHDGRRTDVPADWCLRRPAAGPLFDQTAALSTGVAAGSSVDDAAARAILELIERDAAALWWQGGMNGRPIACEGSAMSEAARLLRHLRAGSRRRAGWLLDISTDLGVPVVAALSFDGDGSGFACGLGAALTQVGAVRKALLELGQMELALQLAMHKQRTVEAALNKVELLQLARATHIHANTCGLVQPRGVPRAEDGSNRSDFGLDALKVLLAKHKLRAILIDHSRADIPVPVAQVICPELQPLPSSRQSNRLRRAIDATGGSPWSQQTPLL